MKATTAAIIFMGTVSLFLIGDGIRQLIERPGLISAYKSSPDCTPKSPAIGNTPCTQLIMTVVDKRYFHHSRSDDTYHLILSSPNSSTADELVPQWFWQSIVNGDRISAKVWRGKITSLTKSGTACRTEDNPYVANNMGVVETCVGFMILVLLVHDQQQRRSREKAASSSG